MRKRDSGTPNDSRGLSPWLSLFCGAALLLAGVLIGRSLAPVGEPARFAHSDTERFNRTDGPLQSATADASASQDENAAVAESDEPESETEETEPSDSDAADAAIQAWNDAVDAVAAAQGAGNRPSAESVAAFKAVFDTLTDEQKTSCLQEALNLFADESFDCLSAILLDSKEPEDVLQSVLGDLTTRSSEVRNAVLRKLAANPSHPLAGDAGELLEGTGFRRHARRSSNWD